MKPKSTADIDTRRKQRTYLQYERLYKERLISREEYFQQKKTHEVGTEKARIDYRNVWYKIHLYRNTDRPDGGHHRT